MASSSSQSNIRNAEAAADPTFVKSKEPFEFDPAKGPTMVKEWFNQGSDMILEKRNEFRQWLTPTVVNPPELSHSSITIRQDEADTQFHTLSHQPPQASSTFIGGSCEPLLLPSTSSAFKLQHHHQQQQRENQDCEMKHYDSNQGNLTNYSSCMSFSQFALDLSSSTRFNDLSPFSRATTAGLNSTDKRKSNSCQNLSHVNSPGQNLNVLSSNVNVNAPTETIGLPIIRNLRKSISLQTLKENIKFKIATSKKPHALYTTTSHITPFKLSALIYDILIFVKESNIQIQNLSSISTLTEFKYKKLQGKQFLLICIAVLSKIADINYGDNMKEQISNIMEVAKGLDCPIKISKNDLTNPLSSSAIKPCTLFLHWICMRVTTFLGMEVEEAVAVSETDESSYINAKQYDAVLNTLHSAYENYMKSGTVHISHATSSYRQELVELIYGKLPEPQPAEQQI